MTEIRRIRKERGMTAEELADKVGVHPFSIYRYESGKREPSMSVGYKIAKVLRCTMEALVKETA